MRYTYRNKKTYKLKNKLKLLLTILFAALISTTGYIISRNVFADPSPYGTATVTYNTGVDGQFEDGTTTNTVTYNLRKVTTKYSHTYNIADSGKRIKDYGNNVDTNEVITMPGATSLTVDIYYSTGSGSSNDWLSVWTGSYPSYTAGSNYNSTGKVTTANGAPDDNNKFSGYYYDNYFINGVEITSVRHCTLTITGSSVTFAFKSNSSYSYGYGYYAIVKANENEVVPTIDDIASGEYKKPIENSSTIGFDGWGVDITTITGNTSVNASYSAPKYSGTYDGVSWSIHKNGALFIGQNNTTQTFTNRTSRSASGYPWYNYTTIINSVRFFGTVNGNGSMNDMFRSMKNVKELNLSNFNTSSVTNMSSMFNECNDLIMIDLTPLNTSNVTNMSSMFSGCKGLTTIDLTPLDTGSVTDMSYMFSSCKGLTTIDLTPLDTSNVTNMSSMFGVCEGLMTIDLTPLDTSRVTNMSSMFYHSKGLKTLDLTPLNTSNVVNMSSMFSFCSSLTTLNLTSLNTSSVTNMSSMFEYCSNLTTLNLTSLNTSNVTDMSNMFSGCSGLTTLNLTSFDTSKVTNMSSMFAYCNGLTTLNLTPLNTSNVVHMSSMFAGCSGLTALNLTPLNTSNVVYMSSMFYGCSELAALNLTPLDTSKVTNMSSMFAECSGLTALDLTPLDTSKVTSMSYMFSGCSGLTALDLTPLDTSKVTSMSSMFSGCSSLTTLDLTPLNTSSVTSIESMFLGCSNLQEINLSNFDSASITPHSYQTTNTFYSLPKLNKLILGQAFKMGNNMRLSDTWTKQGTALTYTADYLMNNYDGATMSGVYLRTKQSTYYAILYENGDFVFQIGNTPESGRGNVISVYDDYINVEYNRKQDIPWYNNRTLVKRVIFNDLIAPACTAYWFYGMINLQSIIGMNENVDFSGVHNSVSMFENCSKLEVLDLGNLNYTFFMSSINRMFYGCTSLQSLDLSSCTISSYSVTTDAFGNTPLLRELTLGSTWRRATSTGLSGQWIRDGDNTVWDAVSLMDEYVGWHMAGTYRWPAAYAILYDTGEMVFQRGNTPDPTKGNVVGTYTGFENTTYANYSNVPWYSKRTNVTTISFEDVIFPASTSYWCYGMTNLTSIIDIEKLDTSNVLDMSYMFYNCSGLTTLDISSFDTSYVTNMKYMFMNCNKITALDFSNFNTTNVTDMQNMFNGCRKLISLDLSSFDTSNVIDMRYMFYGCSGLTALEVSDFDNSSVNNMVRMFSNCSSLTELDLSNFNTPSVTNMAYMFDSCENLEELDLSNFDTSKVTAMQGMFCDCSNLEDLDLTGFDTSKVEDMYEMFNGCSSLTELDLDDFDTSKVTDMSEMFYDCTNLSRIYIQPNKFITSKVEDMSDMFRNCQNLVYVNLSGFDTSSVEYMSYMFADCRKLTNLDLSHFDTSNVESMSYMFYWCSTLYSLDISSFDTSNISSNISSMQNMFYYTNKLRILELGEDWTFASNTGLSKQWLRDGDTTLYTAAQLASSYNGSTMSGTYIAVLTLTIAEEVRGDLANINKNFDFSIGVRSNGTYIDYTLPYSGSKTGSLAFVNGDAQFTLKHGETINVYLPDSCYYNITQSSDGYTLSQTNNSGTLNVDKTATFINTLTGTTPTGIFVDLIPFIIMILFAVGGLVFIKKMEV